MDNDNTSSQAAREIRKAMTPNLTVSWIRGLVGAVVGGLIGFVIFKWLLLSFAAYAGMLPGGLIGVGFSIGAGRGMGWAAGIFCLVAALAFGGWADAATMDPALSLMEYLKEFKRIPDLSKIMIPLGAVASGWFAWKR